MIMQWVINVQNKNIHIRRILHLMMFQLDSNVKLDSENLEISKFGTIVTMKDCTSDMTVINGLPMLHKSLMSMHVQEMLLIIL